MSPLPPWSDLPQRKSPRHPLHDYSQGGMYHITINTENGVPILGKLIENDIDLNGLGKMVESELLKLPTEFSGLELNCFQLMPDHAHIVLLINGLDPDRPDLRKVMQRFKSITGLTYTRWRIDKGHSHLPEKLWKRSYRDTYIKTEQQLENVRSYIRNNPRQLALDNSEAGAK